MTRFTGSSTRPGDGSVSAIVVLAGERHHLVANRLAEIAVEAEISTITDLLAHPLQGSIDGPTVSDALIRRGLTLERVVLVRAELPAEWTTPRSIGAGGQVPFLIEVNGALVERFLFATASGTIWGPSRGGGGATRLHEDDLDKIFGSRVYLTVEAHRAGVSVPIAAVVDAARRALEGKVQS